MDVNRTEVRSARPGSERPELLTDQRGSLSTEYLVVSAIGLFITIGLGALGVAMVDGYGASLQIVYSDEP